MTTVTTRPTTSSTPTAAPRRPGTPRALMQIRAQWQTRLNTGEHIECRRCHQPIQPTDKWQLGHHPDRPWKTHHNNVPVTDLLPEHRYCNEAGLITDDDKPVFPW